MRPWRVRIRKLPHGNWAVEMKRWPWSRWREEQVFPDRTPAGFVAVVRAAALAGIEVVR